MLGNTVWEQLVNSFTNAGTSGWSALISWRHHRELRWTQLYGLPVSPCMNIMNILKTNVYFSLEQSLTHTHTHTVFKHIPPTPSQAKNRTRKKKIYIYIYTAKKTIIKYKSSINPFPLPFKLSDIYSPGAMTKSPWDVANKMLFALMVNSIVAVAPAPILLTRAKSNRDRTGWSGKDTC